MHICIVAEGCYPYIVGGVSSWIQSLILNCTEHQFSIISINPEKKNKGNFKYEIPANVIEVQEVFLDEVFDSKGKWNKKIKLSTVQEEELVKLLSGKKLNWHVIFDLFGSHNKKKKFNVIDFMLSKVFYELVKKSYDAHYTHISFTDIFWSLRSMYITLLSLIETTYIEADLYHSVSTGYAGVVASINAYQYKKPLILTEHGIYTREREEELIKADWVQGHLKDLWIDYFKILSDVIYEDADKVVSLFTKNKEIQVELGCNREKISIIHNGIPTDRFKDVVLKQDNDDGPIIVGSILRVVPIKDVKTMLEAFSIVEKKIDNVEFLIIGPTDEDDAYYEECIHYMNTLGLQNVTFTGRVDVKSYIGKIHIHVLTSISEGQPLSVIETFMNKIPNVTTNVGDCQSLIFGENREDAYGQAGFVAHIMDSKSIADYIYRLIKNPEMRKQYGENGYQRVVNNYSFSKFIDGYKKLYGMYER